ncbi:MAG: rhamnulose-1-phosphate aldolase [Odoribacteraceae bacterium]|jgi:rhamnulose-1-phosphate aldolase|nr:rhamnulose-1-phosphate aldolase [Odoribacteraceae bacterium]
MSIVESNCTLAARVAEIAEVAGYLWERGWAERNGGNISVNVTDLLTREEAELPALETRHLPRRLPAVAKHLFFVTGTGKRMRDVARRPMENGAIIRLHPSGEAYDIIADRIISPTSELPSHLAMHDYMRAVRGENTKVVCHTHPTDLIALTHHARFLQPGVLGQLLWSMIPETRIIVPRGVGIVPYEIPGSLALANATIKALADHDVILWEKHGCLAVGEEVIETFDMIDTLSKSAQIYLCARAAGFEPAGMSKEQLEGLVPVFHLPPWQD